MIIFFLCLFFTSILPSISQKLPDELTKKIIMYTLSDCSNSELFCNLKLTSKKMNNLMCDIPGKYPYFCNYRFAHMMSQEDAFFKYKCMHYLGFISYPENQRRREITDPYDLNVINKITAQANQKNTVTGQNKKWLLLNELLPNKKNTLCAISTRIDFAYDDELKTGAKNYWNDFDHIDRLKTIYFDFEHYTGCQGFFRLSGVIEVFLEHYPQQYAKNIEILHIKNKSETFSFDGQKFCNLRELFLYGQAMPLNETLQNLHNLETLKIFHIPENSIHVNFPNLKTLILKRPENLDLRNFPCLEFLQITKLRINEFPHIVPAPLLKKVILHTILKVQGDPYFGKTGQSNCINISYFNNFVKKVSERAKIMLELQIYHTDPLPLIDLSELYTIWLKYVSTLYLITKPHCVSSSFVIPTTLKNLYIIVDPRNYSLTLHPVIFRSKKKEEVLSIFENFQKGKIKSLCLNIKNKISDDILLRIHNYFPYLQKLEVSLEIKKSMCALLFRENKSLKEIHTPTKIKGQSPNKSIKNNQKNQDIKIVSRRKKNYWFEYMSPVLITFLFLIAYLKYTCKNYFSSKI